MSKFTRQHYELVALAIQRATEALAVDWEGQASGDGGGHDGIRYAVGALSTMFRADNPAFNAARFERACVVGSNVRARGAA